MADVQDLQRRFCVSDPPIDPVEIARGSGVDVLFVTFGGQSQRISGFYDAEENAIYVNADEYPLRQTFTVAHELGHARLHRDWARGSEYQMLMRDQDAPSGNKYEKEANAFAAHLLVPRFLLDRYRHLEISDLSRIFAVSVPVIENRLSFEYGLRTRAS